MAQNNDLRLELSIETDNSIQKAVRDLDKIADESEQIEKSFREVGRASERAFDNIADNAQKAKREIDEVTSSLQRQQDKFDETSKNVSLFGDVGSNASTLAGVTGIEGIGQIGELAELGEALPRLKDAVAGLPQSLDAAASSLSTSSGALLGFGGGIAALTVALQIGQQVAEKSRQTWESVYDIQDNAIRVQIEANQLTSDEIEARREAVLLEQQTAQAIYDKNRAIVEEIERQEGLGRAVGEITASLGIGEQAFAVAREEYDASKQALEAANTELDAWNNALESSAVAANDAAAAELERQNALATGLLAEADRAAQVEAARQQAINNTTEANQRAAAAEQNNIRQLEAKLAILSKDTSGNEQVARAIQQVNSQLDTAKEKLKIFESTVGKVGDTASKASKETSSSSGGSGGSFTGGGRILSIKDMIELWNTPPKRLQESANLIEKSTQKISDSYKKQYDEQIRLAEQRQKAIIDYNNREAEIQRESLFDRKQNLEKFRFDEKRLLGEGSFAAAFRAREDFAFENRQTSERLKFDASQRKQQLEITLRPDNAGFNAQITGASANLQAAVIGL